MADETPQTPPPQQDNTASTDKTVRIDPTRTVAIRPGDEGAATDFLHDDPAQHHGPMDDYAICGKVGDGGMGVVYLARDRRLGRYVAIKRLNEKALADPILRQRFLQEARAVAALNHAHIVHIYALGEDALGPYIIMEYVSGPAGTEVVSAGQDSQPPKNLTLEQFINRNGPMTADEAVAMILKIANTMVYAHSCGVIHRDLKPANILLDPSMEPKLVDFGLARISPQEGRTQVAELTVPGEKLISLGYSAPELEQDASCSDVRADIYSLGAILYFLLTGRNPRYYREQDVPAFLREVMRRSLETVREQRYRTAQDFVKALTEAASHGRTVAPTIKTTWRCKWCDAVNPISTKFCAECGWDGSERCRECGAEIFVGQQYCPSCGADCRMYEHVSSIIALMDQAWEDRHFERIATIAGRLHGFEPAGPTGRKMLSDAHARVEEAERKVARRNRLAALIPNELKAENYERAQSFIEEFRTLNEDAMVYEEELREIPNKILARDLARIRQCIRLRDWSTARRLTENLAATYGNNPEYQDVRTRVLVHARRFRKIALGGGIAVFIVLYLLSMPIAARLADGTFGPVSGALYTPARGIAHIPGIHFLMSRYASLFTEKQDFDDYFRSAQGPAKRPDWAINVPEAKALPPLPDDLEEKRAHFATRLAEIERRRHEQHNDLLTQYWDELKTAQDNAQKAGNYDGVVATTRAIDAYTETNELGIPLPDDPPFLAGIKLRMARRHEEQEILAARQTRMFTRKYREALEEKSKTYTQQGEMDKAGFVQEEVKRIQALPEVMAAQALLKASKNDLFLGDETSLAETEQLREELRATREALRGKLRAINEECNKALGDWPSDYEAALNNLITTFQQSGNFNAWEAVALERSRFEAENTLTAQNIVEDPDGLRQIQETFLQRLQAVAEKRNTAKSIVYNDYLADMEKRKTELTKAGKLDSASVVNQEIREIRQSHGYAAVTRSVAPAPQTSHTQPAQTPQTPAQSVPPVQPVPQQPVAPQPIEQDLGLDPEAGLPPQTVSLPTPPMAKSEPQS